MHLTMCSAQQALSAARVGGAQPALAGATTADAASESAGTTTASPVTGNAVHGLTDRDDVRGVVVLTVEGEIDLYTGPRLRERLQGLLTGSTGDLNARRVAEFGGGRGDGTETSGGGGGASCTGGEESLEPVRAVVIDLLAVSFMDSYALGVLVWAHKAARAGGRSTALVADHPHHAKLFQVTGLSKVMPLHADIEAAVNAVVASLR